GHERVHEEVPGKVRARGPVPAGGGPRAGGEGLRPLTHPHEPGVVARHPGGGVPELVVEHRTVVEQPVVVLDGARAVVGDLVLRSEEHTSELQSRFDLVCRLLLEKKKNKMLAGYSCATLDY